MLLYIRDYRFIVHIIDYTPYVLHHIVYIYIYVCVCVGTCKYTYMYTHILQAPPPSDSGQAGQAERQGREAAETNMQSLGSRSIVSSYLM